MANNNLAALAALAGLAYAANRGKASNKAGDQGNTESSDDTDYIANMGRNYGGQDVQAEDGTLSKFKRNTETGDLYSPDEPITRPSARSGSTASPRSTRSTRPAIPDTGDETQRLLKRYPAPASVTDTGDETERLLKRVPPTAKERLMSTKPSSAQMQEGLEMMVGGPGVKAVAGAAKALANRAPKLAEYTQPVLEATKRKLLTGPRGSQAVEDVVEKTPGPAGLLEWQVPTMGREATFNPLHWMAGGKNSANFKKGGMVKAPAKRIEMSAPKKSSASSRADGIATKGKTRGRIC